MVCTEHDKHVEAFCIDCSKAVCRTCSFGTHADHQIRDLSSNKGKLTAADTIFTDKVNAANNNLDRLNTLQRDFNTDMDITRDKLDKHHDDVIRQINKQHRAFRAQLQHRRDQVNQDLDRSKELIIQAKDCIHKLQKQSASWSNPIPAVPDAMVTDIQDLITDIKQRIPSTDVHVDRPSRLVFVPTTTMSMGKMIKGDTDQESVSNAQRKPIEKPSKSASQHPKLLGKYF
jgi:small-conductance mechanosensitive channel